MTEQRQEAVRTSHRLSRRRLIQAGGAGTLVHSTGRTTRAQDTAPAATPSPTHLSGPVTTGIRTYPAHGTVTASPGTEISFRGASEDRLGVIRVTGSESGGHSGVVMPHQDGHGLSYVLDRPFAPGEEVTVSADIPLADAPDGELVFRVSVPRLPAPPPADRVNDDPQVQPHAFRSLPNLKPPVIEVLADTGETAPGYIFLAPRIQNGQSGSLIVDNEGQPVWFYTPEPDMSESMDFRVNRYRGQPVLTWWEGAKPIGYGVGHYVIANAAYERIATVQVANGFQGGDHHEFLITSRDTALFGIYAPIEWDLTRYRSAENAVVIDQVVQEVEIETGRVLFEWHSLDHIGIDESYQAVPADPNQLYDYLHMNSIGEDPDGNVIISCRHTHSIVMIDRTTSDVMWRLNGARSDFEMGEGTRFEYQHDARAHGDGHITLLDNRTNDGGSGEVSRGLELQLDMGAMTATLVAEYLHPTEGTSHNQANMQVLPNGHRFLGWGPTPDVSEVNENGEIVYHAQLPEGGQSYRAYRFPWVGIPAALPDMTVEQDGNGVGRVYVSWNGATDVAEWRVVSGDSEDDLQPVTTASKAGFETAIEVDSLQQYVAVEALDRAGNVLVASKPALVS